MKIVDGNHESFSRTLITKAETHFPHRLHEKKAVAEIFEEYGEAQFRKVEMQYLLSLSEKGNSVVATGGGTPCYFKNMEWMQQHGTTVYLNVDPAILFTRLKPEVAHRPLLRGKSEEELLFFIKSKLQERNSFYHAAQVILDAGHLTAAELASTLRDYFANSLRK